MTNSLNTPVEALEYAYPFRVHQYAIRQRSGGRGLHVGGNGLVREIELLGEAQVTMLSDRRTIPPWGLNGGSPGARGLTTAIIDGKEETLPGKFTRRMPAGSRIRVESPGAGGWGKP
jgi:N-methylhydantoinase B